MSSTAKTTRLNCKAIPFIGESAIEKPPSPNGRSILSRGADVASPKRDRSGQAIKWRCTFLNTPPKFLLPPSDNVGSSVKHRPDISRLHDLVFGDVSREEARYRLGRPSVIGAQRRPRDAASSTAKGG